MATTTPAISWDDVGTEAPQQATPPAPTKTLSWDDVSSDRPVAMPNATSVAQAAPEFNDQFSGYYSGLHNVPNFLNENQKANYSNLAKFYSNKPDAQAAAINQNFVQTQLPDMPPAYLAKNWEAVKVAYSKQRFGMDVQNMSDTDFYQHMQDTFQQVNDLKNQTPPKPWDWKDNAATIASLTPFVAENFWRSINPELPLEYFPDAPNNLPNINVSIPNTNLVINPAVLAGTWNGTKSQIRGALTPVGVGTAVVGLSPEMAALKASSTLVKSLITGTEGVFSIIAGYAAYQEIPEFKKVMNDPNASLTEKVAVSTKLAVNSIMALATGWGALLNFYPPAQQAALVKEIQSNPKETVPILKREEANTDIPGHAVAIKEVRQQVEQAQSVVQSVQKPVQPVAEVKPTEEIKPTEPQVMSKAAEPEPSVSQQTPISVDDKTGVVSIKNEVMDQLMEEMGFEKTTSGQKLSFEKLVNDVNEKYKADPALGERLVEELTNNLRAPSAEENVILGFEGVRLNNARKAAEISLKEARATGDREAENAALNQINIIKDQFAKTAELDKLVGTASGQSLAFRKVMLKEDYSLSALERKLEVAKQEKLTPEETDNLRDLSERIKTAEDKLKEAEAKQRSRVSYYEGKTEKLKAKMEAGDFTREQRKATIMSPEVAKARAEYNLVKNEFDRKVYEFEQANRPMSRKIADALAKWSRFGALSSPTTAAKLTALVGERAVITPLEQTFGYGWSKILPGLEKRTRFESVPTFSGLVRNEAKSLTALLTKGLEGAVDVLGGKPTELESTLNKIPTPPHLIDYAGTIHKALHTPIQVSDYVRRLALINERDMRAGVDMTEPLNQMRNMQEAYEYSKRSIYVQNNKVVDAYQSALRTLESKGGRSPESKAASAIASGARILNPIVKVPTNVAAKLTDMVLGLPYGISKSAYTLIKNVDGFDGLSYAEADQLMRHLKNGSVGAFLALLGFFKYKQFGGSYQKGETRKAKDLKEGEVKIGDIVVPSFLAQDVSFDVMQAGATFRQTLNKTYNLKSGEKKQWPDGVLAAVSGMASPIPFIEDAALLSQIMDEKTRNAAIAKRLASFTVPAGVATLAKQSDKPNVFNPFQEAPMRGGKAKTIQDIYAEEVKARIPGLRQTLPKRDVTTSNRTKLVGD